MKKVITKWKQLAEHPEKQAVLRQEERRYAESGDHSG